MTILKNAASYDWATWWLGIMRSALSGGSNALVTGMAGMGIAPDKFNLSGQLGNTVKLMTIMFCFQAIYRMAEFLSLHGAPDKLQEKLDDAKAASQDATAAIKEAQAALPPDLKKGSN